MNSKASEKELEGLHGLLAKALADVIKDGVTVLDKAGNVVRTTAPASFFKEAREFLKDNGVEALPTANKDIKNLAASLPFLPEDDEAGAFLAH